MAASIMQFIKCFRYRVESSVPGFALDSKDESDKESPKSSHYFRSSSIRWEGPHLILTRGIQPDRPALYAELIEASVGRATILEISLWGTWSDDMNGPATMKWRLEFDSITDRGFLFLDAEIDAVAHEAVCFENARLVRVNP